MILNNYIIANLKCRITVCYPALEGKNHEIQSNGIKRVIIKI